MLKSLLGLHKPLILKLLITDFLFTILAAFYVLGRGETFTWFFAMPYLFTLFVLFLSVNISTFSNSCGTARFYLILPISRRVVVSLFLLLRLLWQALLLLILLFPLVLLLKDDTEFRTTLLFQALLFQGTITVSTLPVLSFLSRPHPAGVLLSAAYFLSFIPAWIATAIIQEILLETSALQGALSPLLFLILVYFTSLKIIGRSLLQ